MPSEFAFPKDFLWGAGTSAHQVEGDNVHNDWWAWEQAGRVKEPSGLACDHYQRFESDFDLAASLGHNAHRFSIEWSRVEPSKGQWDEAALAHYVEVVRALRRRGLEPVVTLHHYTNPQWVAEAGGWANAKVVDWFARYTERIVKTLGDLVRWWITINEPMVYVHMHYVEGEGPPGARDMRQALRVTEHLIRAHAVSYRILHDAGPMQVSIAKYLPVFIPCRRWWPLDRWAASLTDRLFNEGFLEALTAGQWRVPGVRQTTIREARATLDFLGVNFYRRHFIRWGPAPRQWLGSSCDLGHHARDVTEITPMGWDVHPDSFFHTLTRGARLGLPIFITENGTCLTDDERRWQYLLRHLEAMTRAMEAGVKVIGYLYWSLLDNFEWAKGFGPRFGLIEVDYATQQRRIRESARRYAQVCRRNTLSIAPPRAAG
ncbi:MAG: family 1 glycosylhydrolase [Candidatus Omnitrophica bacterium]|nr:family 1 glycosylhydrolase [Candidatus Omnitrophota bacterium]